MNASASRPRIALASWRRSFTIRTRLTVAFTALGPGATLHSHAFARMPKNFKILKYHCRVVSA
jgi:hypothetical protein